ncbi:rhodanese-like domain-containing protein [Ectobacillus antri]|jgi:rhodanese-related sulfurtransferase|uniref:Rhodanese-like domain-containing protein n=1 Tax=Ectobacillus antri TaxID=2486280 RepID=A0ABT6H5P2_9BACI|nr:rhodanese-like domain-containing protein [Ectobacillus antri]MDG4656937.1 rhodanese-like domain-containing protein [Ectobacillus antri]MDG5754039.1 rhodanese-like domain-containing protein [Ectobacillus antri]
MDYLIYGIFALIIFFLVHGMLPTKGIKQISTLDLKQQLNHRNKQYIDVRTPGEFKVNSIRGFQNIPLQQLPNKLDGLSKEKEIIVICQSGMRSSKACRLLKKQGFQNITNVKGGMSAWS